MSDTIPIAIIPQPPLPTVRIVANDVEGGVMIINRADFDPATMIDADAPKPKRARVDENDSKSDDKGAKSDADAPKPKP